MASAQDMDNDGFTDVIMSGSVNGQFEKMLVVSGQSLELLDTVEIGAGSIIQGAKLGWPCSATSWYQDNAMVLAFVCPAYTETQYLPKQLWIRRIGHDTPATALELPEIEPSCGSSVIHVDCADADGMLVVAGVMKGAAVLRVVTSRSPEACGHPRIPAIEFGTDAFVHSDEELLVVSDPGLADEFGRTAGAVYAFRVHRGN
ncbi:MAG: hypothetical protein IPK60_20915 [Sandaracinaceae bacterium]|nr:hypothetical protein [Sandaracinaceae bacterium]